MNLIVRDVSLFNDGAYVGTHNSVRCSLLCRPAWALEGGREVDGKAFCGLRRGSNWGTEAVGLLLAVFATDSLK